GYPQSVPRRSERSPRALATHLKEELSHPPWKADHRLVRRYLTDLGERGSAADPPTLQHIIAGRFIYPDGRAVFAVSGRVDAEESQRHDDLLGWMRWWMRSSVRVGSVAPQDACASLRRDPHQGGDQPGVPRTARSLVTIGSPRVQLLVPPGEEL